jgi:hypothetical protein|tara:strand:+ start:120 stop:518 length:399 start_codon:yes stop_codon:yes gene_type:complete
MKKGCIILLLLIILFVIYIPFIESFSIIEGVGGRGGRGGRGGGGHHGHHHSTGRRWYGGNWGYRRPPMVGYRRPYRVGYNPRYVPWWTSMYWFGNDCKDGCTNIGNNNWGCQYPGNGPTDCVFARDCYGCGI